jgi:activator of HSP90 ATPase
VLDWESGPPALGRHGHFHKGGIMTTTIRQSVTFPASPQDVYDLLMDTKKHSAFTNAKARISTAVGGSYSAYDGYIAGKNLELKRGKLILQSWRAVDWPEGILSTVKFVFEKVPAGTKLTFTHTDVPSGEVEDFKQGWIDNYWKPMKEYLKNKKGAAKKKG